jgi:predicted DNA-binding protein (MmcQ/YjbR family)
MGRVVGRPGGRPSPAGSRLVGRDRRYYGQAVERDAAVEHCLGLPGAYLDNPWGPEDSVAKVGGKIFAFLGSDGPLRIALKNTPERVDEWRARYPDHIGPGPYLAKATWNYVQTSGSGAPDDDEIRELIEDSYELIVATLPKSKRP